MNRDKNEIDNTGYTDADLKGEKHSKNNSQEENLSLTNNIYQVSDFLIFGYPVSPISPVNAMYTLDELLNRDKQREKDGFPKRIRIGKIVKPVKGKEGTVIVVPTTTEPKFYHDNSVKRDEKDMGESGGTGEEQEGEVIGHQPVEPKPGEGEDQGAGQGDGGEHELTSEAFDLGKMLHEKFQLPNLKVKGTKKAFSKFRYELTDKNVGFGQILDKKDTIKKIVETNIQLGNIDPSKSINPEELISSPNLNVYKILSREKEFEAQAVVFFMRDYSGSMYGVPSEAVCSQQLLIYSWLMYQYKNRVETRFILHDTEAKEVPDFYTYYKSSVAGGTNISKAFTLAEKIITDQNLARDYNIYILYGTDGDDWDRTGKDTIESVKRLTEIVNRIGCTVVRNSYASATMTTFERYIIGSGLIRLRSDKLRLDAFPSTLFNENRLVEGIRKLLSE
ncbi:MAG: DUF444 family protein [Bacteroidales bacterium]|jgi:uncharacterized sporulation protein YeaH/YhbH (DUF444 family)|nr:DUF444 family protein [Bacteroidales bacterium]